MKLPTIDYETAQMLDWCWWDDVGRRAQLKNYAKRKTHWNALDILNLPDSEAPDCEKLFAVLRPELIPEQVLHRLACDFAEHAFQYVDAPDPRSVAAIQAKRDWLNGVISGQELSAARVAARAAEMEAIFSSAWAAARAAAWAVGDTMTTTMACVAASDKELQWQIQHVIEVLKSVYEEKGGNHE